MLRRLALAIAVMTGAAQASDLDLREQAESQDDGGGVEADDLDVGADGRVQGWAAVRLVLPDLESHIGETAWIDGRGRSGPTGRLTLGSLPGRAVVDADGTALGVVRGSLVRVMDGRVLALDVDVVPEPRGGARRIVLPWSLVEADGACLRTQVGAGWVRAAPSPESSGVRELGE